MKTSKEDGKPTNQSARHHVVHLLKRPHGLTLTHAERTLVQQGLIEKSEEIPKNWIGISQRITLA